MLFYDNEVPSGLINGTNALFNLAASPDPIYSLVLAKNGVVQTAGEDFTLSANVLTFVELSVPQNGDILRAWYRAEAGIPASAFGMYRDDVVALIQDRLGQRTGLETQIIRELQAAQLSLESGALLPWFLITSYTHSAGAHTFSAPTGFLRELDDYHSLYLIESSGAYSMVPKKSYELILDDSQAMTGTGAPKYYSQMGKSFHLFPTPVETVQLKQLYYTADAQLTSNIKNQWLTHAAGLLIAMTGFQVARYIRDFDAAKLFLEDEARAMKALIVSDAAQRAAAIELFLGG